MKLKQLRKHAIIFGVSFVCCFTVNFIPATFDEELFDTLSQNRALSDDLNNYIQKLTNVGQFSGAVLIAKDNKILINKGYNLCNYELSIANTPITKFRVGSITKSFVAVAILQLREKGLLTLKDPLAKYIPDYPNGNLITIHHLLIHSSGIPNFREFSEYKKNVCLSVTLENIISTFKYKPLEFPPGQRFSYSNSNYILLTYIIEKVAQQPYQEYLKNNILIPSFMNNTGIDDTSTILENRASGYQRDASGLINANYANMSWSAGAGALITTVKDLYKFDRILYSTTLLTKDSIALMFTPQIGTSCYGWQAGQLCSRPVFSHGGLINGFHALFLRFIEDNACIILVSNFEFAPIETMAGDLAAIIFNC